MSIKEKLKQKAEEHLALESFGKLRPRDFAAVLLCTILWFAASLLLMKYASAQSLYIVSMLWIMTLASLTMLVVRKSGAVGLFFVIGALFTYSINDVGVTGITKIFVLACAGLVFEGIFLLLTLEVRNIPIDIVLGSAVSASTIPFVTALMLSSEILISKFILLLNIIIMSFLIGIAGGILGFFIWFHLRSTKAIIKFEYG